MEWRKQAATASITGKSGACTRYELARAAVELAG